MQQYTQCTLQRFRSVLANYHNSFFKPLNIQISDASITIFCAEVGRYQR